MADNNSTKVIHKMGSTVLDSFDKLSKEKDGQRVEGAIVLLRHLIKKDSVSYTHRLHNLKTV